MNVKNIIKKQTTIVIIAIALVSITIFGVSYALFFDVKTNSKNQVITAGSLKLTIPSATALAPTEPVDDATGLKSSAFNYTIKNTDSSLPASYNLYIYADANNAVSLNNIKFSTDGSTVKALKTISPTTVDDKSCYLIESSNINAGDSISKSIRIWVDENAEGADAGEALNLTFYIESVVQENAAQS